MAWPAIYYADRGPGHDNAALDDILARAGITRERSIARNSQARGVIEAFNKRLIAMAKRLPSYLGADMDPDAKRVVHIRSRQELRATGTSRLLPSWQDLLTMVGEAQTAYNNRPHSALPRIVDPGTGRMRHQSPAERWRDLVAEHGAPPTLSAEELADMFRP
jgi:putative transposase